MQINYWHIFEQLVRAATSFPAKSLTRYKRASAFKYISHYNFERFPTCLRKILSRDRRMILRDDLVCRQYFQRYCTHRQRKSQESLRLTLFIFRRMKHSIYYVHIYSEAGVEVKKRNPAFI